MVPFDELHGAGRILLLVQPEGGEVKPHGPALGHTHQLPDGVHVQLESGLSQEDEPVARDHGEIGRPHFHQRPAGPQAAERDRKLGARGQGEGGAGRSLVHHRVNQPAEHLGRDQLNVVEHEHEGLTADTKGPERPQQAGQSASAGTALPRRSRAPVQPAGLLERGQDHPRGLGDGGRDELVGREPQERTRVVLRPFRDQARLPVARRRDDHRERRLGRLREATNERSAAHVILAPAPADERICRQHGSGRASRLGSARG